MSFKGLQIWSFDVIVLQRSAKECVKMKNARAGRCFCSLNMQFFFMALLASSLVSWQRGDRSKIPPSVVHRHCVSSHITGRLVSSPHHFHHRCQKCWNTFLYIALLNQIAFYSDLNLKEQYRLVELKRMLSRYGLRTFHVSYSSKAKVRLCCYNSNWWLA